MTIDQNKITLRRLVEEGYNKGNLNLLDETFTKDAINHDASQPNLGRGPAGARESMRGYLTAFPDAKVTIEREIAEGDYKKATVTGVIISKFENGKVVETWSLWDLLSLMKQIGVVPTPETADKQPALAGSR
jgi:predicted ester cyclase